jgi:hypothetical protein
MERCSASWEETMKRLVTLVFAAAFCVSSLVAFSRSAAATPSYEMPPYWAYQALNSLAADGLVAGYPDRKFQGDRPRTRSEMAMLIARVIAKLQMNGVGNTSQADLDTLSKLMGEFKDELVLLGVRVTSLDEALKAPDKRTKPARSFQVLGSLAADASFRQRNGMPHTIAGGVIDPFVNAFLTSPPNNSPFEHDPGPGTLVRFDGKLSPTYTINQNLTVSLPIHVIQYNGPFTAQDKYSIQPAVVVNVATSGALGNVYIRGGQLDNLESSRLGLTYSAPDATQQGPGFQNPIQPYENGIELGGVLNGLTRFQFSVSRIDQSLVDTTPGFNDQVANNNYFLVVDPRQNSLIQLGSQASFAGAPRTDSYVASAGPVPSVALSRKAGLGSVYISSVNGIVCTPAGLTPGGANCPIPAGAWYYIDQTNQVVFQSPLPVGTIVQITYSTLTNSNTGRFGRSNYQFQRYHFNARVNQQIKGLPGTEIGLSVSRIVDSNGSSGLKFGDGYGAMSDTVIGLDGRLPLTFIRFGRDRTQHPDFYAEGAYSKNTPDLFNTPAITDSAMVLGLRFKLSSARATIQYQAVGPNFLDGGPLRYLGPGPSTFQFWRGNFFPQFFGFANNLAINKVFDATVTPLCAGTACSSHNASLTYIYPVFNPFEASGPQFFSAFAPNSQGVTTNVTTPLGKGDNALNVRFKLQHLQEMVPNSFGQLAYGPGFASNVRLKFDTFEGGLLFGFPIFKTNAAVNLNWSYEHLSRFDKTAYSYVPFNLAAGGPDASSGAALNAYLSIPGNTPVLFYPNYVEEYHRTFAPDVTIPLTPDLNFGLAYDMQRYNGSYGTTLAQNISQRKDDFFSTLTYNIPKTAGSIGLLLGNQTYSDGVLSTYNFSQTREGLDFSIRF